MKKLCMIFFSLLLVSGIIEIVYTESPNTKDVPDAEKHFAFGVNLGWGMVPGMAGDMSMSETNWMKWALKEMSRMHINTLHISNLPDPREPKRRLAEFARLARKEGIRLIPQFRVLPPAYPLFFIQGSDLEKAQDAYFDTVKRYLADPAILAWSVIEEVHDPDEIDPDFLDYIEDIRDLVYYIDEEIPGHQHPGFVLWGSPGAPQYQPETEVGIGIVQTGRIRPGIVCYDCYPFNPNVNEPQWKEHRAYWENSIKPAYEFADGSPVWIMGQGCANPNENLRLPTPDEMFWQAWLAIVHGAKGIMYFTFGSDPIQNYEGLVSTDGQRSPHWKVMDNVWHSIAPFEKIIVDLEKITPTTIWDPVIRAEWFQREPESERYLIVVNSHVDTKQCIGLSLSISDNIYDLRTLDPTPITPSELAAVELKPGRGNMYLIGTEDDYEDYIDNYAFNSIEQIEHTIDELMDLIETKPLAKDKLEEVVAELESALKELNKTPHDNQAAVGNLEDAVGEIEAAVNDGYLNPDPEDGTQLMNQLAQAARQLAVEAIEEAIDQEGDSQIVAEAQYCLEEGDTLRAVKYFKDAVNKYQDALAKAESM